MNACSIYNIFWVRLFAFFQTARPWMFPFIINCIADENIHLRATRDLDSWYFSHCRSVFACALCKTSVFESLLIQGIRSGLWWAHFWMFQYDSVCWPSESRPQFLLDTSPIALLHSLTNILLKFVLPSLRSQKLHVVLPSLFTEVLQ